MFARSRWYVAVLSHELTRLSPLGRTILDGLKVTIVPQP